MTALISVFAFAEGGEESETINPVVPNVYDIFWAIIFFTALFLLMKYVLLPPVTRAMEQREETLRAERAKADEARKSLASAQADHDQALADARAEGAQIVDAARAEGEAYRSEVIGAAQAEVSAQREAAVSAAASVTDQATGELNQKVSSIAIGAAEKVIGKKLDPASQKPVIDRVLSQSARNRPGGNQ